MHKQTPQLIEEAKRRMRTCKDSYHNLAHVERVVAFTKQIAADYDLTDNQREALELAAWWHDVGRTVSKKPSIIMSFVDDTLSALMLWGATIKNFLFGEVVGLSTRMLFCKNMGTGIIIKMLMTKKNRILVDILKDADKLDIISTERAEEFFPLIEDASFSITGYRIAMWWNFYYDKIKLRTAAAKKVLKTLLEQAIAWFRSDQTYAWYCTHISKRFVDKYICRFEQLHRRL